MLISDILRRKGYNVISIDATASLGEAAAIMAREKVGALMVLDENHGLIGIVSERELVASMAAGIGAASSQTVAGAMVTDVPVAGLNDAIAGALRTITTHRARHLPVVVEGVVVGLVSIGDIVESRLQEKIDENLVLQDLARAHLAAAA